MGEREIEMAEVAQHRSSASLWFVIRGEVYDVTAFLEDHPGGDDVLKDKGGADATQAFDDIGHSPEAVTQMKKYRIGKLKGGTELAAKGGKKSPLQQQQAVQPNSEPMWKKLLIPLILIAAAYLSNQYFTSSS